MQKGFALPLVLAGILLLSLIGAGGYYFYQTKTQDSQNIPVPQTHLQPEMKEETAKWKTYRDEEISFKYPGAWFYEKNPNSTNVSFSFFEEGIKPDHGYADHQGNEVFSFELSEDSTSLAQLKSTYYPDSTDLVIDGKNALRTSFGLVIIKVNDQKTLNIVTGLPEAEAFSQDIILSLKFLK